ncbi:MAG: hypothetical protein AAF430_18495 [Myxococcota bacterium]
MTAVLGFSCAPHGDRGFQRVEDPESGFRINLPSGWKRVPVDNIGLYQVPERPQYNFLISREEIEQEPDAPAVGQTAQLILRSLRGARAQRTVASSPTRGVWYYETALTERGRSKDDRHWMLLESRGRTLHYGVFTLSVLAEEADATETAALVAILEPEIAAADF